MNLEEMWGPVCCSGDWGGVEGCRVLLRGPGWW